MAKLKFGAWIPTYAWSGGKSDPKNRDENIDYYIAKLDELVKKFGSMIPAAEQQSLKL